MNLQEFHAQLRSTGRYETSENPAGPIRRFVLHTDTAYYSELVWSVFSSAFKCVLGCYDDRRWATTSLGALKRIEAAGSTVEITGFENVLRANGPAVVIGNHMSMLETFVLPTILLAARPTAFVVKESLVTYPLFGRILRTVGCVQVGRKNPREDFEAVMKGGEAMLKAGRLVVVFPQSTRSPNVIPEEFNTIGVKLARRVGVPVVPLALKTDFQGLGSRVKDFGPIDRTKKVHFKFAPRMLPEDNPKAIHEACVQFISSTVEGWSTQARGA